MATNEYPVLLFLITCVLGNETHTWNVLAMNSDWAYSMVPSDVNWDSVKVERKSDVIGIAQFGARNVTGEDRETYLNYHCRPAIPGKYVPQRKSSSKKWN